MQVVATDLELSLYRRKRCDDTIMPQSDLVNAFTEGKNRGHFAALLVEKLLDKDTRVRSNIRGKGKEKLDSTIIEYVQIFLIILFISYLGG